jgi:hypothetical protein
MFLQSYIGVKEQSSPLKSLTVITATLSDRKYQHGKTFVQAALDSSFLNTDTSTETGLMIETLKYFLHYASEQDGRYPTAHTDSIRQSIETRQR